MSNHQKADLPIEQHSKYKVVEATRGLKQDDILTFLYKSEDHFIFSGMISDSFYSLPQHTFDTCLQQIPIDDYTLLLHRDLSLKQMINFSMHVFPKAFINHNNELIFVPKHNVYFGLNGMETAHDFKLKMFAWLSRPISKGLNRKPSQKLLYRFNRLLNTQFTMSDMELIYARLGNNVNPELTAAFIRSGYDMELLALDKEITL